MAKIIFSGIQPSGVIHLGNYLGAIKNWVALQEEADQSYYCIVDYHALTNPKYDPKIIQDTIYTNLAIYLACGLDPKKSVIFQQSDLSEHTELAWILNSVTAVGELKRMTQYKDKGAGQETASAGLFDYPVLQASDILLYKANIVPVGEDQTQHLEITRIIARRFNQKYKKIFTIPQSHITSNARIMALNDPTKKMSKSIPNSHICIQDSPEIIKKRIMSAVTDSSRDGSGPGAKNLLLLLDNFGSDQIKKKHHEAAKNNDLSYQLLKQDLADAIIQFSTPIAHSVKKYLNDKTELEKILTNGADSARPIASQTLSEARQAIGLKEKRV